MNQKISFLAFAAVSVNVWADDIQDMSDPLAVYTQTGIGWTQKGLNLKLGQAYDTGHSDSMAQHVLELKGFAGRVGTDEHADGSIDSMRYRHFHVDMTTGRGSQVDLDWNFDNDMGSASYSMIQALPKMGRVQLYPLAGVGISVTDNQGYSVPASFALVGMYGKLDISERIWVNYNPMYTSQLGGDDDYKNAFGINHEAAVSYQLTSTKNVRAFWNWGETIEGTDFRIEMNFQF